MVGRSGRDRPSSYLMNGGVPSSPHSAGTGESKLQAPHFTLSVLFSTHIIRIMGTGEVKHKDYRGRRESGGGGFLGPAGCRHS